jgi:YaeC family lipoprotein
MTSRRQLLFAAALGSLAWPLEAPASGAREAATIRIGTVRGPHAVLLERVQTLAAERGLAVQLDVRLQGEGIDADVARCKLDVAAWQDGVRFAAESRRTGADLVVAAALFTLPMGLYSRHLATPHQSGDGDAVAIPADREGTARALVLLQNFGLIELRDDVGLHASVRDIVRNPRSLRIVTLPASRLYDALLCVAVVAMDFADATRAGLQPARDSIGIEDARTPFGGVLCVRRDRAAQPWLASLVAVLHGDPMKRFALERFGDSVRRPW